MVGLVNGLIVIRNTLLFKQEIVSFKISSDEYSNFIEDVNNFYKTRLEKLYEKSKVSLFPSDELATATQYQQPTTLAAHHEGTEYTEDELKEIDQFKKMVENKRK